MDIRSYYDSLPNGGRRALAKDLNISPAYLYQMVTKIRPIAPKLCRAIQIATESAVTVHDLRPDIFGPAVGVSPDQGKTASEDEAPTVDRRRTDRRIDDRLHPAATDEGHSA
ncbi:YdaS family helix-turn-helix protein [uncultured Lamprocystis sp.]|jgi:DNA-binding transcriptional regulator YdaS (Cro superfamily)|uniref:transcriptional regulator n=1 Tax=uncultured Lamprocystis sp. TaxID=543132 RepID=UPI0025D9CC01|nr:YdaS family helix-turn-helix protein [uncultured Lamprocystis sp.]